MYYLYCLATLGLVYIIGVLFYRLYLHPLSRYPGPVAAKLSGFYAVYHAFVGDLHLDMLECHKRYGQFVRYGPNKLIVSKDHAIKEIYSREANVQKSKAYRAFETTPTAHDLQSTVDTAQHTRKRRVMSQAFSESAIKALEGHIYPHVDAFVACLAGGRDQSDGWSDAKNMAHWSSYLSFDFMAELVFGKSFQMLQRADNRFIIDLIQYAAFRVGVCLQLPQLATWNVDKLLSPGVRHLRDQYVAVSKRMAMERAQLMETDSDRKDLFSHILAAKDPQTGLGFSLDELWGESTLLIVAGSDAISTALASCFFYLGRHREAYARACREVRSKFDSTDAIRSGPALHSCVFLRACVEESLRMSPPVGGALWREVREGGLRIGGELIPAGCDVGVGIYAIQHDEAYFPSPFAFSPERWISDGEGSSGEAIAKAKGAFSAFSIGPVGCLGKNLAYMELMVTMGRVLWALDLRSVEGEGIPQTQSYLGAYPEHAELEYHLRDRFTSWKDGPMLEFQRRKRD